MEIQFMKTLTNSSTLKYSADEMLLGGAEPGARQGGVLKVGVGAGLKGS